MKPMFRKEAVSSHRLFCCSLSVNTPVKAAFLHVDNTGRLKKCCLKDTMGY